MEKKDRFIFKKIIYDQFLTNVNAVDFCKLVNIINNYTKIKKLKLKLTKANVTELITKTYFDEKLKINEYLRKCFFVKVFTDNLVITSDQFSNTPETVSINTNDKEATYKMNDYDYILLTFLFY